MIKQIKATVFSFFMEEDGLALTEYLILLGILIAAVITAVTAVGGQLSDSWDSWRIWFQTNASP